MELKIQYNPAFDVLAAIDKYSDYCFSAPTRLTSDMPNMPKLDYTPSKQIKSWLANVDNQISPFMKSDLQLITRQIIGFFDTYSDLLVENNLESIDEFLTMLKTMSAEDLTRRVYQYYNVDIPYDDDNKAIHEGIVKNHDEHFANIFIQIKRFPEEYKFKAISLLESFYNLFVKPQNEYVAEFIDEKLESHNAKFAKDPVKFLNAIGIGDYTKILNDVAQYENPDFLLLRQRLFLWHVRFPVRHILRVLHGRPAHGATHFRSV